MVCLSDSQLPNTVWLAYPLSLILMTFFTFMLMQYISPTRYIHSPIIICSHVCLNLQTTACSAFLAAFTNVPVALPTTSSKTPLTIAFSTALNNTESREHPCRTPRLIVLYHCMLFPYYLPSVCIRPQSVRVIPMSFQNSH